jgi:hypothetical protein
MLDDRLSTPHLLRMKTVPAFHVIQDPFFLQPGDPAAAGFPLRAFRPSPATVAGGRGVIADVAPQFITLKTERQPLAGRADVAIAAFDISEIVFREQAFLAVDRGVGLGDPRGDPFRQAGRHLLAVVVPHVG